MLDHAAEPSPDETETVEFTPCSEDEGAVAAMTKTKAFVDNYLPALLGQAWHLVSTEFHQIVEQHGLSVLEWRVLSTLASDGPMTISALAQTTVSKQPTVTRLLVRLEAQGYVERATSKEDRRYTQVKVTRKGRGLITGLIAQAEEHERMILAPFKASEIDNLKEFLKGLIERHRPPV